MFRQKRAFLPSMVTMYIVHDAFQHSNRRKPLSIGSKGWHPLPSKSSEWFHRVDNLQVMQYGYSFLESIALNETDESNARYQSATLLRRDIDVCAVLKDAHRAGKWCSRS